jgi:uncharacterized protein
MAKETRPLRINVGFIVHEGVGYSHEFEFDFPELQLAPDLHITNVSGMARFTRTSQGLLADVQFAGVVHGECVRCLDEVDVSLATKFNELYAFDGHSETESDLIIPEDRDIDLGPLVREYILLDMPINPLCKPDCLGICLNCGKNLNKSPHTHDDEKIDPRFSILKDLLDKGKE